jgi:hypothetical protein
VSPFDPNKIHCLIEGAHDSVITVPD